MVDRPLARQTVRQVERWQRRFRNQWDTGFVYASDEFYLQAGMLVPATAAYDDYPQMENGVGLVRDFLDRVEELELPGRLRRRRNFLLVTGTSFHPFLDSMVDRMMEQIRGFHGLALAVRNRFFGETVTVAGLLTGQDVIEQASGIGGDALILPSVVLRDGHGVFLDDVTVTDLEQALGMPVKVVDPTPEGLLVGVREAAKDPR
jgi:NifB/MoaA-like Fe-S oxidoreductase